MEKNKYEKGKVYKITDIAYNKCYIGSTCDKLLSQRLARHKEQFKRYGQGKANWSSSFKLFEEFGVENCKIELIEEYPCENRHQLSKREGFYIQSNDCVNKQVAGRTKTEYKAEFKDWYLNNQRERYYKNKEQILQKLAEKTECECGSVLRKSDLPRHLRTNKHQDYIKSLTN